MIQRIQTVYLLLAIISLVLSFFFPFAEMSQNEDVYVLNAFGFALESEISPPAIPLGAWAIVIITLLLISILMFKKRKLQIRINWLASLLLIGLIVYIFLYIESLNFIAKPAYKAGIYFVVAALPFLILANRAIKKDEKLVKSLDRIR